MQKIIVVFFVLALLLGCDKEKKWATYHLNFQLVSQGSNYNLNESYSNSDGFSIKLESLLFYLADLRFLNTSNEEIEVLDIDLINFDLEGKASTSFKLPPGNYHKVKFGIGVPAAMNEADPSTYNTIEGHPLNGTNNTYWGWTAMYRFVMLEGRFDTDNDGNFDGLLSLHTGYNDLYREVSFDISNEVKKKVEGEFNFEIDVYDFFDASIDSKIFVETENQYHGSQVEAEKDIAKRLSDNFAAAISLK